jgi:hypothetical protein
VRRLVVDFFPIVIDFVIDLADAVRFREVDFFDVDFFDTDLPFSFDCGDDFFVVDLRVREAMATPLPGDGLPG